VEKLSDGEAAADAKMALASRLPSRYWLFSSSMTEAGRISVEAQRAGINDGRAWAAANATTGIEARSIPRLLSTITALQTLETFGPETTASERQAPVSALRELAAGHAAARTQAAPTATPPSEMGSSELRALFDRPVPDTLQRSLDTQWAAEQEVTTSMERSLSAAEAQVNR
jgi:hypothetical protein